MNLKVFYLVFVFAINFDVIFGQEEFVSCRFYMDSTYGYMCEPLIYNPNGLNNFVSITGTHLPGYSDNNVANIKGTLGSNTLNIPSIICQRLRNSWSMELKYYGIQRIDDYSFNDCTILSVLSLGYNSIHTISAKAFNRNSVLEHLFLEHNKISSLPENVFLNQYNLTNLLLTGNKIIDIPKNTFKPLKKLRYLLLDANQISNLQFEWFENLSNLAYLNLNNNFITNLPKNIFSQLKLIDYIGVAGNNLKTIHADSFGFLPRLEWIDAYNNQINAIDENLINYTVVRRIDLRSNFCASRSIFDDSILRDYMRAELSLCFYNYENQMSGEEL